MDVYMLFFLLINVLMSIEGTITVIESSGTNNVIFGGTLELICSVDSQQLAIAWYAPVLGNTAACRCQAGGCSEPKDSRITCEILAGGAKLQMANVNLRDTGEYKCVDAYAPTPTTPGTVRITVQVPITGVLPTSPTVSQISVVENRPYSFSCLTTPSGRPDATVKWYRGSDSGPEVELTGAVSVLEPSGTLSATRSTLSYTATNRNTGYQIYCKAYNMGPSASHNGLKTTVTSVQYPPVISPLQNQDVIVSTPLIVQCTTTPGNPAQTSYRWTRSTDNWSKTGQTLSVPRVTKGDAAVYTCTATNVMTPTGGSPVDGTDFKAFTVNVLYAPVIKPLQNRAAIASSPLTVQCTTTPGNPAQTSYRWTRSTDNWSQDGQTLSLPNVTKGDAAVYTCTAWNVMIPTGGSPVNGTDTKTFTLDVLYTPVISPLQNKEVIASSPLTVQCTTTPGNPAQTSYRWTRSTDSTWSQTGQTLSLPRVTKGDAAVYTCTSWNRMTPTGGSAQDGTDKETFTLDVLYPPVINPLQNRAVIASSPLTVQCTITPGNPTQTSYRWTRRTDSTWSHTGQTLGLSSVTKGDAAVYTCTATNVMTPSGGPAVDGTDTETFTVNVLYPPVISPLQNIAVIASSPLSVQCTTTPGNPAQTSYRWTRSTDSTWSQPGQTMSLPSVTKGNATVYTCTATNVMTPTGGSPVVGTDTKTFTLDVLYKASVTSFKLSEEAGNSPPYTVNENDIRTFQCHVDSNPAAQITIRKQDGSQLVDKNNVYEVSHVKTLGCLDAGNYTCSGNNQYNVNGKSSMDLGLFVRCHPRLNGSAQQNITVYKARYEPVTLSIVVIAYPLPTFSWSVENNSSSDGWTPISANITSEDNRATMTIGKLELSDFRQYKVEVKNSIPPDYSQYWIIEPQGKPDVPTNVRVKTEGIKETSTVVQWTPGFNGGLEQTFIIQYTTGTDGADGQWTEMHGGVETTHIIIENLSPNTVYTVRVYANNTIGMSDISESFQFTTIDRPATASSTGVVAAAVGGTCAAIVLIAAAVGVIVIARRRGTPACLLKVDEKNSNSYSNSMAMDTPQYMPEYENVAASTASAGQGATDSNTYEGLRHINMQPRVYESLQTSSDTENRDERGENNTYEGLNRENSQQRTYDTLQNTPDEPVSGASKVYENLRLC